MVNGQASGPARKVGQAGDAHVSPEVSEVLKMLRAIEQRNAAASGAKGDQAKS